MRNIPDVSVNADPTTGYDIYVSGGWGTWGGTSAAAPIWAGFVALVNQQRATSGMGPSVSPIRSFTESAKAQATALTSMTSATTAPTDTTRR